MELCEAEVENFGVAAVGDENVGGLYVAMNDVFLMGGIERVGNFNAERDEHFEGDRTLGDVLLQCGALEEFHGDEGLAVCFANVVDGADVGMIECGGGLGFALEAGEGTGVVADIFGKKFQRYVPMKAIVFGFVDDAHAAGAEAFENAIVGERLADEFVGAGHERDMLDGGLGGGQCKGIGYGNREVRSGRAPCDGVASDDETDSERTSAPLRHVGQAGRTVMDAGSMS